MRASPSPEAFAPGRKLGNVTSGGVSERLEQVPERTGDAGAQPRPHPGERRDQYQPNAQGDDSGEDERLKGRHERGRSDNGPVVNTQGRRRDHDFPQIDIPDHARPGPLLIVQEIRRQRLVFVGSDRSRRREYPTFCIDDEEISPAPQRLRPQARRQLAASNQAVKGGHQLVVEGALRAQEVTQSSQNRSGAGGGQHVSLSVEDHQAAEGAGSRHGFGKDSKEYGWIRVGAVRGPRDIFDPGLERCPLGQAFEFGRGLFEALADPFAAQPQGQRLRLDDPVPDHRVGPVETESAHHEGRQSGVGEDPSRGRGTGGGEGAENEEWERDRFPSGGRVPTRPGPCQKLRP